MIGSKFVGLQIQKLKARFKSGYGAKCADEDRRVSGNTFYYINKTTNKKGQSIIILQPVSHHLSMSSFSSNETISAAGGIDVNALVRIHDRLQSTSDESLPPILVNIIAKIIPLTNQDDLRTKAVEVITESLRRAKAIKCSFPLEVFVPLVQSRMLPFACNFGIAFLDAMSDLNCVTNINTENIISLLDAIASYNLHIYQSNAILYFALLYSDRLTEALLSHPQQDKLLDIVGDYFLDFILLQHLNLDNVAGSIQPGLSEKRVLRLKQKKKQFAAVSTKVLKQQVLDALFGKPFIDTVYATLLCLIASADADKDVAAKGKQVLNRMKDDASYVSLPFGLSLLSCTFNFDFDKMKFGKLDRTNYRLDVQIVIVEYLVQQFAKFSKFHVDKVSLFVYLMVQQLTANGSRSETTDRLLVSLLELMRLVLLQDPSRGISLTLSKIIMRLCKAFLPQFVNFSTSVVVDHQHGIRLRGVCYELIQLVLDNQQQELCQDIEALVLLFQVAEKDELSGSTILFKVLSNLREVVDIKGKSSRLTNFGFTSTNFILL